MTTTAPTAGVFPDVPELDYHARRFGPAESLSSTEARRILEAPAVFRWHRDHPTEPRKAFDLGHVVHALVLGTGLDLDVIPTDLLSAAGTATTKAARDFIADSRAAGHVPVKAEERDAMRACADAVLTHELAGPLLEHGTPEQSVYALDEPTGTWMRGRIDWQTTTDGEDCLIDLKTTEHADPTAFTRSVTAYGYDLQREWYRTAWATVTNRRPDFLHVVVEKHPPYLVSVVELDLDFEEIGRTKTRQALDTYAACLAADQWPGYPAQIHELYPPDWYVTANGLDEIEVA